MSVTAAEGFVASGCHAGIKRRRYDMALVATDDRQPVTAAAVFTQNKFFAPPVGVSRARARRQWRPRGGDHRQFGQRQCRHRRAGLWPTRRRCARPPPRRSASSPVDVLVCSTGIIGTPLPMDVILAATPKLAKKLSVDGGARRRQGHPHHRSSRPRRRWSSGSTFTFGGMAKGCGMIAPNMATMLAFLTTDAEVPRDELQRDPQGRGRPHASTRSTSTARPRPTTRAMLLASGRRGKPDIDRVRRRGAQGSARI